jgi:hypothetical protein
MKDLSSMFDEDQRIMAKLAIATVAMHAILTKGDYNDPEKVAERAFRYANRMLDRAEEEA